MSKEEIDVKVLSNSFVFSELFAIISGDGMGAICDGVEQIDHSIADRFGRAVINFAQQGQTRFALRQGDNSLVMSYSHNGVHFPISNPLTLIDDLWALLNTSAIRQFTPAVMATVALAALLLAAQVFVQITPSLFIAQDVLIDPLMTDLDMLVFQQPARNLFRAPIHMNFGFDQRPDFRLDPALTLLTPAHRQVMGLLWSIATLTTITAQLSTDRGFVHPKAIGDLRLVMTHFHKRIYLVSLCLGKLFVGLHKCSFDLADQEALILPQLTSFSAI